MPGDWPGCSTGATRQVSLTHSSRRCPMSSLRGRPRRSVSPPAAGAATLDPTAQRILVVEDSDSLRAVAVRTLSAGGYAVAEARHGEDALRVIDQSADPFDL